MTIRVIDIESTGLDPKTEAIVEIASVDMVKGGGITNAMQTFVAPGRPIPAGASAVHHIVDEDVAGAPSLAEAIERFRGADAYVAHKAEFERGFLVFNGIDYAPWVCTFKCALRAWPEFEAHNNQFLRYQLGLASPFGIARDQISPHRAASDVIVTAAILEKLLAEVPWSQLIMWSNDPALYTRFHFGKYRGQRYDAVDPSYLQWIIDKSDLEADVKFSARHWLNEQSHAREVAA
jgi:exodeoxyribonuclease X